MIVLYCYLRIRRGDIPRVCDESLDEIVCQVLDEARLEVIVPPPRPVGVPRALQGLIVHRSQVVISGLPQLSNRCEEFLTILGRSEVPRPNDDHRHSLPRCYHFHSNLAHLIWEVPYEIPEKLHDLLCHVEV